MISGRDALHQIDASISNARKNVAQAINHNDDEQRRLLSIRKEEANVYGQISDIRLHSLGQKEQGVDALGRTDKQATDLLEHHDTHVMALEEEREKAAVQLEQCELDRREAGENLTLAITQHEAAAEKTRLRLETDPDYQTRAEALEKANAIVDHAASKREVAANDRTEKGKPYEADPLFSYLHKRKFATKDYKAGPLTTMLDRWVAKLIKYRDARLNYKRLLELPERLGEHLAFVEEKAAQLAEDIEAYERTALENDGVTKLRDKASTLRDDLDRLDTEIIEAETTHHDALTKVEEAGSGAKGPLMEARTLLTDVLQERSIPDLKVLAAETLTPEDDALVEDLAELRLERYSIEEETRTAKRRLDGHQRTLSDLEKLRRRFKQARFDSHRSQFKNDDLVSLLLTDFVRGSLSSSDIWRKIERNHRLRRRDWEDDFGGDDWRGGFGIPNTRGPYPDRTGGANWGRIGRDISREIQRELGRGMGRGIGGGLGIDLDDILDLDDIFEGGYNRSKNRKRYRPRRPRSTSRRRSSPTRRSRSSRSRGSSRRGGGGFKTGGGF